MEKLVQVLSLAGTDVAGIRADLRSRTEDGELMYSHTAETKEPHRILKRIHIKKEKGHDWLYWEWEPNRGLLGDCGYSGVRMDNELAPQYYLLIEAAQ